LLVIETRVRDLDRFLYLAALASVAILVVPLIQHGYRLVRLRLWWRHARVRLEAVAPDHAVGFPASDLAWAELALRRGLVSRVEPYPRQVYVRPATSRIHGDIAHAPVGAGHR
jgi:hypothetical protein